ARREHCVAVRDARDGVDELVRRDRLGDVAACARAYDGDDILGRVAHGQREEPHIRIGTGYRFDDACAAASGHVHVEEHDVGLSIADHVDRGVDIRGGTHDLDLV